MKNISGKDKITPHENLFRQNYTSGSEFSPKSYSLDNSSESNSAIKWDACPVNFMSTNGYNDQLNDWITMPDQVSSFPEPIDQSMPYPYDFSSSNFIPQVSPSYFHEDNIQAPYLNYNITSEITDILNSSYCSSSNSIFHSNDTNPYSQSTNQYIPQNEYSNTAVLNSTSTPSYLPSNQVTPPPTPPDEEGDKFKCLYMLVDAAISQWEKRNESPPPHEGPIENTRTYLSL